MKIAIVDDFADERALLRRRLKRQLHSAAFRPIFLNTKTGHRFFPLPQKSSLLSCFSTFIWMGKTESMWQKNFAKQTRPVC